MKDANITIKETKQKIIDVLNDSKLPISVCALIVREIARDITEQEKNVLLQLESQLEKSPE